MRTKRHSVSSLMVYEFCPWQYYLAFVEGVPPPVTQAMRKGTNIHALIAAQFGQLELFPPTLEPDAQEMLDLFRRSRFNIPPIACEQSFTVRFGDAEVCGRIDLVLPAHGEALEIVDFKTGKLRTRDEVENDLQLPLYALAAGQLYSRSPESISFTYFFLRHEVEHSFLGSSESLGRLTQRVERVLDGIRERRFNADSHCKCWACRRKEPYAHRRSTGKLPRKYAALG